jgi:serine acetyltransferase
LPVLPLLALYAISGRRATLDRDVRRRMQPNLELEPAAAPGAGERLDALRLKEFRSVFYSRLRYASVPMRALAWLASKLWRPQAALEISCDDLGDGFMMLHGFATMVAAERIGDDCMVCQQVTIGWTDKGRPVIGDRVLVMPGAKILGPVKVGNDVIVAANAVVVKDVEPGSTVAGIPAKAIGKTPAPWTAK